MSHLGHRQRMWETLQESGLQQGFVHPYQKLELLLTFAIPRVDTKPIAKELLARFGSLSGVLFAPLESLLQTPGVGPKTAHFLRMMGQFHVSLNEEACHQQDLLDRPDLVKAFLKRELAWEEAEFFSVLFLNGKNRLIRHKRMFRGTFNQSPVFPREIVKEALAHNAVGIIVAHNHPSQDPTPSSVDRQCTQELIRALKPVAIRLHDHFVIAARGSISIRESLPFLWHEQAC